MLFLSQVSAEETPSFYGEEVVVTASRIPQLKSSVPASVTVITSEEIVILGAKNMTDVLDYTYGTLSKRTGYLGSLSTSSIQGASFQQMLILIDGQRVNSPLLGGYDLGDIPVKNIERVEIVRGPSSALYGADAVGGVINIFTKDRSESDAFKLTLSTDISEHGANDGQISVFGGGPIDYYFTGGNAFSSGYRDNGDYTSQNFSGKMSKNINDASDIEFGFDLDAAQKGVPGSLTFPTPFTRQNDNNEHFRLSSWTKVNDAYSFKLSSSYGTTYQMYSTDALNTYDRYNADFAQYEFQNVLKFGDSDIMSAGAEYRNDGSRSDLSGDHLIYNKAVYLMDQHFFTSDLSLSLSDRLDSHSTVGDTSSPKIGVNYQFSRTSSVWASYGEAYRSPTLNDLYTYYVDPVWGMIMRGNTSLKPEDSKSTQVGVTSAVNDQFELSADYFSTATRNLITWVDVSGTWSTWEAQNINSANISGYELGITYHVVKGLNCSVNYTAMDAIDGKTGKDLPYKPKVQYNADIEYTNDDGDSAAILFHHVGKRYADTTNTTPVDPYTVTTVNLRKTVGQGLIIRLGAENFFNEDYQDTFDYPMPGRIYTFGIQYNLI